MATLSISGSVLITGATSGIGAAYAECLAARGHDLVLVAQDVAQLEEMAAGLAERFGVQISILPADLSDRDDLARVEWRLRADSRIGGLVNSTCMLASHPFLGATVATLEKVVQLNITAVMRLAAAVLPAFVERGRGTLINISSGLALAPESHNGAYGGASAFVVNFSQSLQAELAGSDVQVQLVLFDALLEARKASNGMPLIGKKLSQTPMGFDAMAGAALVGLARGELITIPALRDETQWHALQSARLAMVSNLSSDELAARYTASL